MISKAGVLWAKKSSVGQKTWLPLAMHLMDTAEVGVQLWDHWLCEGAKVNIAENVACSRNDVDPLVQARSLFVFLCASHDLGKATPAFQAKDTKPLYAGLEDQCERDERDDACHDLDRFILSRIRDAGFACADNLLYLNTPHALCSLILLKEIAGESVNHVAAILGAHHGKPQSSADSRKSSGSYPDNFYGGAVGKAAWREAQKEICDMALKAAGCFKTYGELPVPNQVASVELCGLLIMADWISSNEWLFPYIRFDDLGDICRCKERARSGFEALSLTHPWQPLADLSFANAAEDYYMNRFGFKVPNPLQKSIIEIARNQKEPGIMVIEAPMGCGKTETALAAAEILAKRSGRAGVFFALPTQATSNGIFPRLLSWVKRFGDDQAHSVELFHCRAEFNEDWARLRDKQAWKDEYGNGRVLSGDEDDTLLVNDWFSGRKKAMLADFVVGTIDQLLMAAFKQKHVMLRHLGLANKVVIIDECHAYDAYMSVYLERVLEWLGKYRIPTVVLSATLTSEKRETVINAYMRDRKPPKIFASSDNKWSVDYQDEERDWVKNRSYPVVTYNKNDDVVFSAITHDAMRMEIKVKRICDSNFFEQLKCYINTGGCIGVIVNTVRRAQELSHQMRDIFGDDNVLLFHSRFLMPDRANIERKINRLLGKPGNETERPEFKIVIGTQVLEQSLDIDFDVLFTDLAPMDLLIQRMGRLHRHERTRPSGLQEPVCYVLGGRSEFNRGTVQVYGEYLLMRTLALLPDQITFPDDISILVENVYDGKKVVLDVDNAKYEMAKRNHFKRIKDKEDKANAFRIDVPNCIDNLTGWLDFQSNDNSEWALVRDITESVEVILVQELEDGYVHLFDDDRTAVSKFEVPDHAMSIEILKYRVSLPHGVLDSGYDNLIRELESCTLDLEKWQDSRLLYGNLILIMDKSGRFNKLHKFDLMYSKSEGLSYLKKECSNA